MRKEEYVRKKMYLALPHSLRVPRLYDRGACTEEGVRGPGSRSSTAIGLSSLEPAHEMSGSLESPEEAVDIAFREQQIRSLFLLTWS